MEAGNWSSWTTSSAVGAGNIAVDTGALAPGVYEIEVHAVNAADETTMMQWSLEWRNGANSGTLKAFTFQFAVRPLSQPFRLPSVLVGNNERFRVVTANVANTAGKHIGASIYWRRIG